MRDKGSLKGFGKFTGHKLRKFIPPTIYMNPLVLFIHWHLYFVHQHQHHHVPSPRRIQFPDIITSSPHFFPISPPLQYQRQQQLPLDISFVFFLDCTLWPFPIFLSLTTFPFTPGNRDMKPTIGPLKGLRRRRAITTPSPQTCPVFFAPS